MRQRDLRQKMLEHLVINSIVKLHLMLKGKKKHAYPDLDVGDEVKNV